MVFISIDTELEPPPRWLHRLSAWSTDSGSKARTSLCSNDQSTSCHPGAMQHGCASQPPWPQFPWYPQREECPWGGQDSKITGEKVLHKPQLVFFFMMTGFVPGLVSLTVNWFCSLTTVWNPNSTPTTLQRLSCIPRWWGREIMKDSLWPLPTTGEKNDPSNHLVTQLKMSLLSNPASPSFYKVWHRSGWFFS